MERRIRRLSDVKKHLYKAGKEEEDKIKMNFLTIKYTRSKEDM